MKKTITIISIALFMVACGQKSEQKTAAISIDSTKNQVALAGYQCPMKCEGEKVYDKAGKCPSCGMDMQKIGEDAHHHAYSTKK